MSKLAPVVIVDSSDSEHEGSASENTQASIELRASENSQALVTLLPSSIPPVASASVNNTSTWIPGTRITNAQQLRSFLLASSLSDSETETEINLDFSTPPVKTSVKANWKVQDKKMGEDVAVPSKTVPH